MLGGVYRKKTLVQAVSNTYLPKTIGTAEFTRLQVTMTHTLVTFLDFHPGNTFRQDGQVIGCLEGQPRRVQLVPNLWA